MLVGEDLMLYNFPFFLSGSFLPPICLSCSEKPLKMPHVFGKCQFKHE